MIDLPEAPASSTIKATTPNGYEVLFTSRDFTNKELTKNQIAHALNMDKSLKEMRFTQPVRGFSKPVKPIEYVENRICPTCGSRLVYATKKDGSRFIKCSTNKYINGQATGCPFVEWPQQQNENY